ncbi:zonular occludens toxin domain-containing protein [Pseudoxanthomonas putridarboris]|uniref:Zonular occludens toxin domain-containing protein n=1 Tax=Pseudoxanthomonas putridarboris TaxID=752605 RepID=A0ABU9J1A5_9GAMM
MIYWYTGQPGHGKTLHAIERLLEFKDQGRIVYACNVRGFDYAKTGVLEMTPEQFRDWPNFLPDGAVALVDEAYEHGMLPKRPPGSKVPHHVEQLAKHRHRGLDFVFVSQSPDKQCDQFVHDLIERHIHVRRRFGTKYVTLREFDRFEAHAEKATPLVIRRKTLPKRPMGTYQSTEMDTTEVRIPWYFWALGVAVPLALFLMWYTFGNMNKRLGGATPPAHAATLNAGPAPHGAAATGGVGTAEPVTPDEYEKRFTPLVASMPWSAPAYDRLAPPQEAPRIFCMSAKEGVVEGGDVVLDSCTCLTDQGTTYPLEFQQCAHIARHGQYEPYFKEGKFFSDGRSQVRHWQGELQDHEASRRYASASDRDVETSRQPSVQGVVISYTRAATGP